MSRSDPSRPAPEAFLVRASEEQARARRGKLTIFFGAAPGVGKTYAMLEAARFEREEGRDVVVGVVETHGRYDTGALLLGLELLPRRKEAHRGLALAEFDLDAALTRRPGLLLVDELAHTNAQGSRHAKRWQDVEELLDAGIDVHTTLNVQHLESLNDVVAQIARVTVRETVPDAMFEKADDVRLVDLPEGELLERLREGKVYVPEQAALAREGFFREGNLIALRELALRITAQRVDARMQRYRARHGIDRTWAAGERLLVCLSPSPASLPLLRAAKRLAASLHADWIAAYVEGPSAIRLGARDRRRIDQHLALARSLGAETVTLGGEHGPTAIVTFARARNVTRILVGKPTHARWRDVLRRSFLDELVRSSGDIDVHVLSGARTGDARGPKDAPPAPATAGAAVGYAAAFVVTAIAALFARVVFGARALEDVVMIHLLGVVLVSMRWGVGPSLTAAVLSILFFDFFFVEPYFTLSVTDVRHVLTFTVMLLVASVISSLTQRVRDQAEAARERELRTASLYALSRSLSGARSVEEVLGAGITHLHEVFGSRVVALVPDDRGRLHACTTDAPAAASFLPDDHGLGVAGWVWQHGRPAGNGTTTLPSSPAIYLPLEVSGRRVGVLGLLEPERVQSFQGRRHVEAFLGQIAASLDRARLAEEAATSRVRIEREQLRNMLLSSVSHDLRTPLAVITGAASTMLEDRTSPEIGRELTETILGEAERLHRLVRNLLDMTRLEAGAMEVKREWQPFEETLGSAIDRVESILGARSIAVSIPPDLPLGSYDPVLVEQVLVNLLENAVKYTPADGPLEVIARDVDRALEITLSDRGAGIAEGDELRIFEKFHRAERGRGGGVGLGLTICQGIVRAHGGRIWAAAREGGGASFTFTLPIVGEPPILDIPTGQP